MAQEHRTSDHASSTQLIRFCHDLRQYVAAGVLLSQMPDDDKLDEDVRRRLDLIHQQFRHVADLIGTMAGDFTPRRWDLDLASLVDDCVRVVHLTHDVSVEVYMDRRPLAHGDPVLLRGAVINVLDNAARAVGQSGTVTVRIGDNDEESWVEISDDGLGFGQIEGGTGHGLSIVNAAVRASHGRLEISSGPGPGTSVRITLPTRATTKQAS